MSLLSVLFACYSMDSSTAPLSSISEGELIISEIMHDPVMAVAWRGEWIEIYNAHSTAVNLQGLEVSSSGENGFIIDARLSINAGDYAVLGAYQLASENGGNSEVDYQYRYDDFTLFGNETITIENAGVVYDTVSYDETYPLLSGKSLMTSSLDSSDNDQANNWCTPSSIYGDGDYGTPGKENDSCLVDLDGDGVSVENGDCDDSDGSIYPYAIDVEGDGIDQDCDGFDLSCTRTDCHYNEALGNGFGVDLVYIDGATFTMGSPETEVGRDTNENQVEVTLRKDFYMMTTEVSQGMYQELMGYDSRINYNSDYGDGVDVPAYFLNWHMAAHFANTLTEHHNTYYSDDLSLCYECTGEQDEVSCFSAMSPFECDGYRMVTEFEFEYVQRAGTTTAIWTPFGGSEVPSDFTDDTYIVEDGYDFRNVAWFYPERNDPYGAKPIALKDANSFGVYDMNGNVWEWTHGWYTATIPGPSLVDPVINSGVSNTIRGGNWVNNLGYLRSANRSGRYTSSRYSTIGFRVARTILFR